MRILEPTLGRLEGMSADQVNAEFRRIIAEQEWGAAPAFEEGAFAELVSQAYIRPRLFTYVDFFCGAGGSSIGLTMAGGKLLLAANHSARAIETHESNFRDAEHQRADLTEYPMRRIPRGAHLLWGSPICTEISPAGGNKRQTLDSPEQLDLMRDGHVSKDVFERTRATFWSVISATEVHRFPYVIVENVIEAARDWLLFGIWLDGMVMLGYEYQIVCVSSAHIGAEDNPHAPQRRDRMYVVFSRKDCAKPDVAPRPLSHCDTCGLVEGVQWWKQPNGVVTRSGRRLKVGKYGIRNQYLRHSAGAAGRDRHRLVRPGGTGRREAVHEQSAEAEHAAPDPTRAAHDRPARCRAGRRRCGVAATGAAHGRADRHRPQPRVPAAGVRAVHHGQRGRQPSRRGPSSRIGRAVLHQGPGIPDQPAVRYHDRARPVRPGAGDG